MRFLLASSIDSDVFDAKSVEEAVEHYKKQLKYRSGGMACKDQYLCLIIAVHSEWNTHLWDYPKYDRYNFTLVNDSMKALSPKAFSKKKQKTNQIGAMIGMLPNPSPKWWELIDWNTMEDTWWKLTERVRQEIRDGGKAPKYDR
jgi:hypothetical protein